MKYGETLFIIVYLLIDAYCGTAVLRFARNKAENLMGYAILILGIGDAFHLIPRMIDRFSETDVSFYLGSGKLITSVTMTIFYVILYIILRILTKAEKNKKLDTAVISLCALRIAVCLFPQNGWFFNRSDMLWGTLRNIPFALLGGLVAYLYFKERKNVRRASFAWLLIVLSFLFYLPVAVFAGEYPLLGMLMIPKTVCYIILVFIFYFKVTKDAPEEKNE